MGTKLSCCPNCFENSYIQQYINENYEEEGSCPYCKAEDTRLISVETLGIHMRECIEKAYEPCDAGTGVVCDADEGVYLGPKHGEAQIYSIREIMTEVECVFSDVSEGIALMEDLFENIYSHREIQKGAEDPFTDIDSHNWVVRNDLYGSEQIYVSQNWAAFKHIVKHYSRFFDLDGFSLRENCLECMNPYIYEFITDIPSGTRFFRARRISDKWRPSIADIEPYNEMGAPPVKQAKTNRMSPAGIPYLYLASNIETTVAECRIEQGETAIIAEFVSKEDLQILDLSSNKYFSSESIFNPAYNHDNTWMDDFWSDYVQEISLPVSEDVEDHSYEYAATQLVAEYYRSKGYDGICFRSSVGHGRNYVFFMGPDPKYTFDAYPYPFGDIYWIKYLPVLREYTEVFKIDRIMRVEIAGGVKTKECRSIST